MYGAVSFETVRWGVLAFVLSRLATRLQERDLTRGFEWFRGSVPFRRAILAGVLGGVVAAVVMYVLAFAEQSVGYIDRLPWPLANGEPVDARLAVGAGLRNLAGEEVFARLGAQALAFYFFRGRRGASALAIIASALYFEIWHNPFERPEFLNFAGSCVFGWAYHKHGYESAAVAHCVADVLVLVVLPIVLFRLP